MLCLDLCEKISITWSLNCVCCIILLIFKGLTIASWGKSMLQAALGLSPHSYSWDSKYLIKGNRKSVRF